MAGVAGAVGAAGAAGAAGDMGVAGAAGEAGAGGAIPVHGPIFMAYTMDRYLASTVECQESFRGHSRVTLNALDEMAAQDKVKAARGRGGRVRGGEDARGARRGAAWRGRVAGRVRQCRWTIWGVCAA